MTVILFFPKILRNAHRSIFQLDRLEQEGYNLILLDATKYYRNDATATEDIILRNRVICTSKEDLINFVRQLPEEPVLYITFDHYVQFATPVLDLLVRKKDKLLTYHTKFFTSTTKPEGRFRSFFDKTIREINQFFPTHFFGWFYRRRYNFYIPDYFLCSTDYCIPTKVFLSIPRENRIVVHADDLNKTLEDNARILNKNKRTGVFLDQNIPFINVTHPLLCTSPPPEGYIDIFYENLRRIFGKIQKQLDLDEIVIALHPDAVRFEKELEGKYEGFRTFMGETHNLVRDAKVVLGHCSTALSYAVVYNKPVVILKDRYMMEQFPGKNVRFFIEELGMKDIFMDQEDKFQSEDVKIDKEKYEDYKRKFLKDNDIQENSYFYAIQKIQKEIG